MHNFTQAFSLKTLFKAFLPTSLGLLLSLFFIVPATPAEVAADVLIGAGDIYVAPAVGGVIFISLRVVDPEGEIMFDQSSDGNSIQWIVPSWAPDGYYSYEVTVGFGAQTAEGEENEQPSADLRPWVQGGTVTIRGGAIVPPTVEEGGLLKDFSKSALLAFAKFMDFVTPTAYADQVILDDLIIDGSACVGFDCVNGESFGFDTIRLKENNLRIRFVDTSSTSSFPTNDWQITINDTSNGGANKFSIDDIDGGRTPFTIEASAPSHSLYVDDGGRVGFGTSTPVVDLHLKTGNTPTLRLEQDGSSGFTPQTWDVASNEANFFIRDVTGGSTLPFRIRPGAPSSAIDIAANGDVGIGTSSPSERLHVKGSTFIDGSNETPPYQLKILGHSGGATHTQVTTGITNSRLTIMASTTDDSAPRIQIVGPEDSGPDKGTVLVDFGSKKIALVDEDEQFRIRHSTPTNDMDMIQIFGRDAVTFPTGDIGIATTSPEHKIQVTTNGAWSDGTNWVDVSTREAKDNILELKTEEALETLKKIQPVKFSYKQDPYKETNVGFIAEDVPNLVATKGRKGMVSMEVVAVLTKVVQEQQKMIEKLNKEMMNLKDR